MEPKFVTKDEFIVVGMECISKNENGEFGQLWGEFLGRMNEIENRVSSCGCYGLCGCGPDCDPEKGECKCDEAGFRYMACVEVSNAEKIPAGMVTETVPGAKYAVFTHVGGLDKLHDTYNNIYQSWLSNSGCEVAGCFCFELYDERFNPTGENSELDIYVPVK